MRLMLTAAAIAIAVGATAAAQRALPDREQTPSDASIIDMCGARLAKVFAQFGNPEEVYCIRASKPENDTVALEYGSFNFRVRDKVVRICTFFSGWKGTIKGIKIGDSREQTVSVLGPKQDSFKNEDGWDDYGWDLKASDAVLWIVFDKDDKVRTVTVELNLN